MHSCMAQDFDHRSWNKRMRVKANVGAAARFASSSPLPGSASAAFSPHSCGHLLPDFGQVAGSQSSPPLGSLGAYPGVFAPGYFSTEQIGYQPYLPSYSGFGESWREPVGRSNGPHERGGWRREADHVAAGASAKRGTTPGRGKATEKGGGSGSGSIPAGRREQAR